MSDVSVAPETIRTGASRPLPRWVEAVVRTDDELVPLILRITLAVVMFPHGAQKVLGWFGGYGFDGTMGFLTGTVGLPWILGVTVIAAEFLGSIALLAGVFGRIAAVGIAANMIGAILTIHASNGFFMDWNGTMAGEGFEFHLLALALALGVLIQGSGRGSIDRVITLARA